MSDDHNNDDFLNIEFGDDDDLERPSTPAFGNIAGDTPGGIGRPVFDDRDVFEVSGEAPVENHDPLLPSKSKPTKKGFWAKLQQGRDEVRGGKAEEAPSSSQASRFEPTDPEETSEPARVDFVSDDTIDADDLTWEAPEVASSDHGDVPTFNGWGDDEDLATSDGAPEWMEDLSDSSNKPKRGFIARLKQGRDEVRAEQIREELGADMAGLDISSPTMLDKLKDRLASRTEKKDSAGLSDREVAEEKAAKFAELLTPMTEQQIRILQAEVASEEPLFVRVERSRLLGNLRQQVGFLVGLLSALLFMVHVGPEYLTQTLAHPDYPTIIPASVPREIGTGGLFLLGLITPIFCIIVISDTVHYLWRGIADRRADDVLLAILAGLCGLSAYALLNLGVPVTAAGLVATWMLTRWLVRRLNDIGRRRG